MAKIRPLLKDGVLFYPVTTADSVVLADSLKTLAAYLAALPHAAYGTCATAAGTAEKAVTLAVDTGWRLVVGAEVAVKFSYTNTASNPTLNVAGTGAKRIWYSTALLGTSSVSLAGTAGRMERFMYDGTYWVWIGHGVDSNTTYSSMSVAEGTAGTATTQRTLTAANLKAITEARIAEALGGEDEVVEDVTEL